MTVEPSSDHFLCQGECACGPLIKGVSAYKAFYLVFINIYYPEYKILLAYAELQGLSESSVSGRTVAFWRAILLLTALCRKKFQMYMPSVRLWKVNALKKLFLNCKTNPRKRFFVPESLPFPLHLGVRWRKFAAEAHARQTGMATVIQLMRSSMKCIFPSMRLREYILFKRIMTHDSQFYGFNPALCSIDQG